MKTYTYDVTKKSFYKIINDIELKKIRRANFILIQVFSGESVEKIESIVTLLKNEFPIAKIITASSDGEIIQDNVIVESTVVSISTFKHTTVETAYVLDTNSFHMGVQLAKEIVTSQTKLLIAFADGLKCNGEDFLEGIYSVYPNLIVAGGLTADNGKFINCYVGVEDKIYDNGAVGVALNSENLYVNSLFSFGWETIGIKHKVTKSKNNRVYAIDDISAEAFYKKYLGENIANSLPTTGVEFPLIIERNGIKKARAVLAKHDDGSLYFAGNINEGESVYLGIGEAQSILSNHIKNMHNIPVESFFIYSCMARRRFIPELISKEITPFTKIAQTSGFFTYGEFYTVNKPELLNQTLTAIAISESSDVKNLNNHDEKPRALTDKEITFQALTNIINVTSKELHEQTILQEQINQEFIAKSDTLNRIQEMAHLGSWELDLNSMKITWSKESYKIYEMNPKLPSPTYDEFLKMVVPTDRDKLINIQEKLNDGEIHSIEIRVENSNGKILNIVESGKLIMEDNKPIKIVGVTLDITELRLKDNILMQQAKLAQMGEMINMIAHQWRQPLNAISGAAIKLNMQNDMGITTKEDIKKSTEFIENMSQNMSQIIDDFINFTKPTNKKELIQFEDILKEIFNIINPQLVNYNINVNTDVEKNLTILTYKKELEHVMMNIIANARDALKNIEDDDKGIEIKIYPEKDKCKIEISDNAGGISDKVIERVFEPYYTTKEQGEGTGLGLYMSRKIVEEHLNGTIIVNNTKIGAKFTIVLRDCYE